MAVALLEPTIGNVIPDMVLCTFTRDFDPRNWKTITALEGALVAAIEMLGGCTYKELLQTVFITEQRASNALGRLEKIGSIEQTVGGRYSVSRNASSDAVEIVAVEFKLRKWAEALEQAFQYRRFADRSYVILDGTQVRAEDKIIQEFRAKGVGLLLQFGRKLSRLCDPEVRRPCSAARLIIATKAAQEAHLHYP